MLTYLHPETVKRFLNENGLTNVQITLEYLTKFGKTFQKMPYENLTKVIRSKSTDDPEAIIRLPELLYEDFKQYGTGGTCFSMTCFMQTILKGVGFETYPIMADRPLAPNTHCASIIVINGKKYLLDPGFMIDRPLPLTEKPTKHDLNHNNILIGLKGTVPIPDHQLKYFEDFSSKAKREESCSSEVENNNNFSTSSKFISAPYQTSSTSDEYTIATHLKGKTDIRYFMKDEPISSEKFLDFWLESFNWPTLRNLSITTATNNGYIYARNNFIRTTTKETKSQTRIKNSIDLKIGKAFNIDPRIVREAFELI